MAPKRSGKPPSPASSSSSSDQEDNDALGNHQTAPAQEQDNNASGSDSEAIPPSPSLSGFMIKPINRKPKPKANLAASPKRITTAWSQEDEIALLNGLLQYHTEKQADPVANVDSFYDFIQESLPSQVSKKQLRNKIGELKGKYLSNVGSQDLRAVELCRKIWCDEGSTNKTSGRKTSDNNFGGLITLALPKIGKEGSVGVKRPKRAVEHCGSGVEIGGAVNVKSGGVDAEEEVDMVCLDEVMEMGGYSEEVKEMVRKKAGVIGNGKVKDLRREWRKLKKLELELYARRIGLVSEQSKLFLDAIKS